MSPRLDRKLVLEAPSRLPDGAGGMVVEWLALGTLWAEVVAGTGREAERDLAPLAAQSLRITVRAGAESTLARPRVGQRFAEGERRYRIKTVFEPAGAGGLYLTCLCAEEVAP